MLLKLYYRWKQQGEGYPMGEDTRSCQKFIFTCNSSVTLCHAIRACPSVPTDSCIFNPKRKSISQCENILVNNDLVCFVTYHVVVLKVGG